MQRSAWLRGCIATSLVVAVAVHRRFTVLATGAVAVAVVGCGSDDDEVRSHAADGGAGGGAAGSDALGTGGASSGGQSGSAGISSGGVSGSDSATPDASAGAAGTSGSDAGVEEASARDGGADATLDAPVSTFCGDSIRDPVTEECDDRTGSSPLDSCNWECRVDDMLVHSPNAEAGSVLSRRLGIGRHTVAGGASGFAVVTVQTEPDPIAIGVRFFDPKGVPGNGLEILDNTLIDSSDPTIAALPGGQYALAYTDLNEDGSSRGVALRILDSATSSIGPLVRVNTTTYLNQQNADVIWTGSELVVAWQDESQILTQSGDTVVRRFSATGGALGGEEVLGATPLGEAHAVLAEVNGTWAVAWRMSTGAGLSPNVIVQYGNVSWTVPFSFLAMSDEKPTLVGLDATHLLVLFIDGNTSPNEHIRGAILDTAQPGTVSTFALASLVEPYASDTTLWQRNVAATRAGDRVFVSWASRATTGSLEGEETWLKELSWSSASGTFTLDLSKEEVPLPRQVAHRAGRQERPSVAAVPLQFETLLATTWVDYNETFGAGETQPDVVAELIPIPILRLPDSDGGLAK